MANKIIVSDAFPPCRGEVSLIIRNVLTGEIEIRRDKNAVKTSGKEILARALAPSAIWDSEQGEWVTAAALNNEFNVRYIWIGSSEIGAGDALFYETHGTDENTPKIINPGFVNNGSLIAPVSINEPTTPLKRIENIYFSPSYQPPGNPLIYDDVRAVNNSIVFETVIKSDEYNTTSGTGASSILIAEVGLIGAAEVGLVGECDTKPDHIFLGSENDGTAIQILFSGTATISVSQTSSAQDVFAEGDTIKITADGEIKQADVHDILDQHNAYYLILNKVVGGRDMTLDRVPVDADNTALSGIGGAFRVGHKMLAHKIFDEPFQKTSMFEVTVSWEFTFG